MRPEETGNPTDSLNILPPQWLAGKGLPGDQTGGRAGTVILRYEGRGECRPIRLHARWSSLVVGKGTGPSAKYPLDSVSFAGLSPGKSDVPISF